MNRRKFIYRCASCALISVLGYQYYKKNHPIVSNNLHLRHVEINLVEHCNLSCKYCSHFSNIAKEKYYDVNQYEKDMAQLAKVTEANILNIQLLGGEPLLHPQVNEFFKITRKLFPKTEIDILTNGVLLDSMDNSFWEELHNNRINLCPSIYPIKLNWKSILDKAKKYKVNVAADGGYPKITLDNIEEQTKHNFYKVNLDLKGKQNIFTSYNHCSYKIECSNYMDGKLYPCQRISNIYHFNEKFNKNLKVSQDDYIDVYKVKNIQEIIDFYNKPVPFCKYCKEITPQIAWKNSKEHSIKEWT